MHIYVYAYVCIYVYVCVYMYIYVCIRLTGCGASEIMQGKEGGWVVVGPHVVGHSLNV